MYSSEPAYGIIAIVLIIAAILLFFSIRKGFKCGLYKQSIAILIISVILIFTTTLLALIVDIAYFIFCIIWDKKHPRLIKICGKCGNIINEGDNVCSNCGAKVKK
ncbi:zinc-ribbon domain-containing protein [uncultured Thomasclavelia sp.]|uniref:zinc-ribbon domain-containing protein n=1 Tax=uncultured Thomasclavelia sp. TaxID=3025759 RepID=UPI00280B02F0|nr:zinc-ribbon domain-containing protein [uncultured Thomasclavelia sp.]